MTWFCVILFVLHRERCNADFICSVCQGNGLLVLGLIADVLILIFMSLATTFGGN